MKNKLACLSCLSTAVLLISTDLADAQSVPTLVQSFDLGGEHTPSPQYFMMESRLIMHSLDGKRIGTDVYRLRLKCIPAQAERGGDEYTCARFTWQPHGDAETPIPALTNWTYVFATTGQDEKGQVFGIDHGKFERIVDGTGRVLPPDKAYHVYNAFIDFHAFCNVLAERTAEGRGIQDLKRIGDKVVHTASFSEPPVNLGSQILAGSVFKNGEITLEFKGLSQVNGRSCALVGYDSGESSFKMLMKPMPQFSIQTVGSSHYFGDVYKDLTGGWVQRATMTEIVVSETTLPMPPNRVHTVVERLIEIRNVSREEFGL